MERAPKAPKFNISLSNFTYMGSLAPIYIQINLENNCDKTLCLHFSRALDAGFEYVTSKFRADRPLGIKRPNGIRFLAPDLFSTYFRFCFRNGFPDETFYLVVVKRRSPVILLIGKTWNVDAHIEIFWTMKCLQSLFLSFRSLATEWYPLALNNFND